MGDDTPKDEQPEDLTEFLNKMLGGESGTEEFFAKLENPMAEAFVGFHELYNGLLSGGFTRLDALQVLGVYLYQIISGMENN